MHGTSTGEVPEKPAAPVGDTSDPGGVGFDPAIANWSRQLAVLLLRLPLANRLDAGLGSVIQHGRLDRTDALAGLIRYVAMGMVGTVVYFGLAVGLHALGVAPNVTSAIAICISVVVSFIVHSRVTFQSNGFLWSEAARFSVVGVIGLTVSRVVVEVVHLRAEQPFWLAALVVCFIVPLANFAAMNFWVFGRRRDAGHG